MSCNAKKTKNKQTNNLTPYFSKFCKLDSPIQPGFCNDPLEIGCYKREILE